MGLLRRADEYPFLRQLSSPLSRRDLRPLDPRCRVVQFDRPLADREFDRVAGFMTKYPNVPLRAYGLVPDLEWLSHFPTLRRVNVDCCEGSLLSIDGLRHLPPDLIEFDLGRPARRLSLAPLARFTQLQQLRLDGDFAEYATISRLRELREVFLASSKLKDLNLLSDMPHLSRVGLQNGGTTDLDELQTLPQLEHLSLSQVRGLTNLSVIGRLSGLHSLELDSLRHVSGLPDLSGLTRLTDVVIRNMASLTDLEPLARLPKLERLTFQQMRLSVEQVAVLKDHPTLQAVSLGIGSLRREAQAQELLGLPAVT